MSKQLDITSFFTKPEDEDKENPSVAMEPALKKKKVQPSDQQEKDLVDPAQEDDQDEEEEIQLFKSSKTKKDSKINLTISSYIPLDVSWTESTPIPFNEFSRLLDALANDPSRLAKIQMLSDFMRSVLVTTPSDLVDCIYLLSCSLGPSFQGRELGVGSGILKQAIASSTGRSSSAVYRDHVKYGDYGDVAYHSRMKTMGSASFFKPKPLRVKQVFEAFLQVSETGEAKKKQGVFVKLLRTASPLEAKYIIRIASKRLRIGCNLRTIITSLARAVAFTFLIKSSHSEEQAEQILISTNQKLKRVWVEMPVWDSIVPNLLKYGIDRLSEYCHLTVGIPVKAMLANPAKSFEEIVRVFDTNEFTVEYKYDGERAQIHYSRTPTTCTVKIFSRNAEDLTEKYPDLVHLFKTKPVFIESVTTAILDCEVVAFDRSTHKLLPFQELQQRKRKDVTVESITIPVCIYAFDILYLNEQSLLPVPLRERRKHLVETTRVLADCYEYATYRNCIDISNLTTYMEEAIQANCEGLMVKTLDELATYEPDKRSQAWLKLKKDYIQGLGDSFDLVVIGAYRGRGKRVGNWGSYLLAVYNEYEEKYQAITKCATGFSDENLQELPKTLREYQSERVPEDVDPPTTAEVPDIWFEPKIVWEVKAADISISPVYKAAIGEVDEAKGLALRFPRFLRSREDKPSTEATSASRMVQLYHQQYT